MHSTSSRIPVRRRAVGAVTRVHAGWPILLCAGILFGSPAAGSEPQTGDRDSRNAQAAESGPADRDWLSQVEQGIQESEYRVTWQAATRVAGVTAAWQAPNRAHRFRTYFTGSGMRVVPQTEAERPWDLGLSLLGYGRGADVRRAPTATLAPFEKRIDLHRGSLREFYVNDRAGLEQGFLLSAKPESSGLASANGRQTPAPGARRGSAAKDDGAKPAYLVLKLTGTLSARLSADGQSIDFAPRAGGLSILHYGQLRVHDANGRELRAWMEGFAEAGMRGIRLVFEDKDAVYPVTVDPLMTSASWTAEGDRAGAEFGFSVSTAGDINGDGFDDVIVGSPSYDNGQPNEGRAFVYLGSPSGLSTTPAWTAESDQGEAKFGFSVSTAGDENGDGYDDVVVGCPRCVIDYVFAGRAYVYHGSASGLSATPAWTADGGQGLDAYFGHSVSAAGNVNGDRVCRGSTDIGQNGLLCSVSVTCPGGTCRDLDDVVVAGLYTAGPPVVYYGGADGDSSAALDPGATGRYHVSSAGDVNGDGYDDVIVGNEFYWVWVFYGSSQGIHTLPDWAVGAGQDNTQFGYSVSTAGDVNGDGYDDVIVGAPKFDNGQTDEGRAFVYLGAPIGLATTPAWTLESDQAGASLGYSVASAGDVNGDGYGDVIVGAARYGAKGMQEGKAWVYQGSPTGLAPPNSPVWSAEGNQYGAHFGASVATAGDVNGDGYDDVIIGASSHTHGQSQEGAAFVYHGMHDVTGWRLASHLGFEPGQIDTAGFGVTSGGRTLTNNETPEAVSYGPFPGSVLVTTGRIIEKNASLPFPQSQTGIQDVDWDADGSADTATLEIKLNVPPWAGTLRFTTQYLTNEDGSEGRPFDADSARLRYRINGWSVDEYPLDDLATYVVNAPVSHCLNVAGFPSVTLRFTVVDSNNSRDSGLLISRAFFSQLPFPPEITAQDGVDGDGDGVVDYLLNPAPHDVSQTAGTYSFQKQLFTIPGMSMPFSLTLSYNSEATGAENLARKWSHNYQGYAKKILIDANGDGTPETLHAVLVRYSETAAEYFVPDGAGGYKPKYPGSHSRLTEPTANNFRLVTKNRLAYDFTTAGDDDNTKLLAKTTDTYGNSMTFNHATAGGRKKVASVVDTRGEQIDFHYDADGLLTSVQYDWQTTDDPPQSMTSQVSFSYDLSTNDLISFTDLGGHTTTFTYDDFGDLLSMTDADGVTTVANSFEQFQGIDVLQTGDRVVSRRSGRDPDPSDAAAGVSFRYDGEAMIQQDRLDREETRLHDVRGQLARKVDATGVRIDYLHDRDGNVTQEIRKLPSQDGTTATVGMVNDEAGNLLERTDFPDVCVGGPNQGHACESDAGCPGASCGARKTMTYDADDNLLTTTDHLGRTTRFAYDANRNPIATTDPLGNVISKTYDLAGRLVSTTDARGFTQTNTYDSPLAQPTRVYSPVDADDDGELDHVTYAYDALGRRTEVTDANGHKTSFEYDGAGQLTAEVDALGRRTDYTYDAAGHRTQVREPGGAITGSAYSATGKLLRSTNSVGDTMDYTYDAEDRLVRIQDGLGRFATYEYDAADNPVRVRACDASQTICFEASAAYDEVGNLTTLTDPMEGTTHYEYDLMRRVTRETDPLRRSVSYTYDGRGLLASKTNARGQTQSYEYDAAGRLTRVAFGDGSSIEHTLDAGGNPVHSVSNHYASVSRVFDPLNRMVQRMDAWGNVVSYKYDPVGNLIKLTYPTDADGDGSPDAVDYTYDKLNRLKTVTDWRGRTTTYTYDVAGNLVGASLPDGSIVTYSYDLAHRLIGIEDQKDATVRLQTSFTLDRAGQLTSARVTLPLDPLFAAGSDTFVCDSANQLVSHDAESFDYDEDGNMTDGFIGGAAIGMAYNELSQLVAAGNDSFRYDVDGLRVETTIGGVTRRYVHDPTPKLSRLLEEHDASGNLVARYVYGVGLIARESAAGALSIYHFDSRGSTVALTNASGTITDLYAYGPYGAILARQGSTPNPFTYNARDGVRDDGNGLYYMRARYYAPSLGRFIQKDQIFEGVLQDTQSLNRHAFVQGNPILRVDPTGRLFGWDNVIAGLVGAALNAACEAISCGAAGDCTWEGIVGAGIGGFAAGAYLASNPLAFHQAGAIAGAATSVATELLRMIPGGEEPIITEKGAGSFLLDLGIKSGVGALFGFNPNKYVTKVVGSYAMGWAESEMGRETLELAVWSPGRKWLEKNVCSPLGFYLCLTPVKAGY